MPRPGGAIGKNDATEEEEEEEMDKPDASNLVDLGSPVSPLLSSRRASAFSSSSSGSSGSIGGGARDLSSASTTSSPRSGSSGRPIHSPRGNALPAGNICPSGNLGRTGSIPNLAPRSHVLGIGTANYGHGSIVKTPGDLEDAKRAGNERYRKGEFLEALKMYDRAISIRPGDAACRSNRAAALSALGRLGEAVRECEEATRLDPTYGRAHHRLASLYLRLGQLENAKKHLYFTGELPDPMECRKLETVDKHTQRCGEARRARDWNGVLRESESAIAAGADSSLPVLASKVEALCQLHRVGEADHMMSEVHRLETLAHTGSQPEFFGMVSNSYVYFVRAQLDMALGRFESAESAAERARGLDPENREVASMMRSAKLVLRARKLGNELFNSGKFEDACLAYGEGLKSDPFNPVLYCNRAASYSKIGCWHKVVEDCTMALKYHPKYTKALLRRAASYEKLEKWVEAIRDYGVLKKELPQNNEVAESLFRCQIALENSLRVAVEEISFGGEVEKIANVEQFRTAASAPGASIVYFMSPQNHQCLQLSPFVDSLSQRYPSLKFHKVNVEESRDIASMQNVRIVPTIKFYRNGAKLKEMICPSQHVLEYSVRHYAL